MDVATVAGTLVCLVLLHQRNELFCCLAFSLKAIAIRRASTSVHLFALSHELYARHQNPTVKLMELPPPRVVKSALGLPAPVLG
jgi:hypothetical protein